MTLTFFVILKFGNQVFCVFLHERMDNSVQHCKNTAHKVLLLINNKTPFVSKNKGIIVCYFEWLLVM